MRGPVDAGVRRRSPLAFIFVTVFVDTLGLVVPLLPFDTPYKGGE